MLAHKAEHEGVICVEAIKGLHPHPMDKRMIPGCTYCAPQIASVGLTEQAAKDQKLDVRVGPLPVHRQRQGGRARRGPGHGQDDLRQEDRSACSAPTWSAPR
jgi:pyruvate/2-oxoglutarate dehydrogenase complex dihydrolipoamide dehydrogenase (E3) component